MRTTGLLLTLMLAWLSGCSSHPQGEPLRVGVMADYPPLVYHDNGAVVGMEADFAKQLATDLHRPLATQEYASLPDLFQALHNGDIDIVMSGISITPQRQQQFLFSLPYTSIGQMAMIRMADAGTLTQPGAVLGGGARIGYKEGSTGAAFVQARAPGNIVGFDSNVQATQALMDGEIDVFIHDAPTVWNLANSREYKVPLLGIYRPLTREQLAWAMSKGDAGLKQQVDEVLRQWMENGFLTATKTHWMPVKILAPMP